MWLHNFYSHFYLELRSGPDMNDIDREIIALNWSPPFEGPQQISQRLVNLYFDAYSAFSSLVDVNAGKGLLDNKTFHCDGEEIKAIHYAEQYTWQKRLKPGDVLVFNNRRMLHGRNGYSGTGRHLIGCYTNIDETICRYRLLQRSKDGKEQYNAGNGSIWIP